MVATTDFILLGIPAALNNVHDPVTIVAWIYPFSMGGGNGGRIYTKEGGTAGASLLTFNDAAGTSNTVQVAIGRATTNATATGVNNTLTLSAWNFVAGTYASGGAGPQVYWGTETRAMAEVTYATGANTRTDGSGALSDDSANNAYLSNRSGLDRWFDSTTAHISVWAGVLTVSQLETLRLNPNAAQFAHVFGPTLKGYWPLAEASASVALDASGNNNPGTVTGFRIVTDPAYTLKAKVD